MQKHASLLMGAFVVLLCAIVSAQYGGWNVPSTAKDEKNPLPASAANIAKGKALYTKNCQRCHGALGKGDGPDSDPQDPAADLSDEYLASTNPDGVMYYRIFGGHPPQMPAFQDVLAKDDIWAVVLYAKTLRKPAAQ